MKRHRILIVLGVFFVSLVLITIQTQARVQSNLNKGVVFVNQDELLRIAKSSGLKVHIVKFINLSRHDLEKLAKVSGGCGCAVPELDDANGGWGCFTGCLSDAGVSYGAIVTCAGVCGISLPACAACLGTGEWIAMYCSLKCAWGPLMEQRAVRAMPKLSPSQTQSLAKLRVAHSPLSR
jgi:hypothetical protein